MRSFLVVVMVLLTLQLKAQEQPLMTQKQSEQVLMDFLLTLEGMKNGLLKSEAARLRLEHLWIASISELAEEKKETAKLKERSGILEQDTLGLRRDLSNTKQQLESTRSSYETYKTEAKKKQEIAFKALYREIDRYQMGLFGLAGAVIGGLMGYAVKGETGVLIGCGIGAGAGVIAAIVF